MEALYKKLYAKYTKLKTNKLSEFHDPAKEQEHKFRKFVSASEQLIDHLRNEYDKVLEHNNDLVNELTSIRLAKDNQLVDLQKLLMEETKKSDTLFEEVEKLQKLLKEGTSGDLNNSNNSSVRMTRKRMRQEHDALDKEAGFISCEFDEGNSVERESTQCFLKENASNKLMESSTSKVNDQPGIDLQESGRSSWLAHALFEYTLGFSFSISWIGKTPGEEAGEDAELLYQVKSLGMLERVVPEWMTADIKFSPTMCPIFFERVSRVINLKY
ncbi:uncharacterized protein LOC127127213 isoform X4 [Lathyrus oleraceus]|uniref:uncharacterized protein LOC127127213 isoform X4 n=1 Tax=Pisum sativum TaxID=3888 RepID=UPI0021D007DB|nr:uncharacterized protein LOC127127213 isoform X4 [Pisum sativum]